MARICESRFRPTFHAGLPHRPGPGLVRLLLLHTIHIHIHLLHAAFPPHTAHTTSNFFSTHLLRLAAQEPQCHAPPIPPSHAQPHPHHRPDRGSCHPRHRDAEVGRPALAQAEGKALRAEGDGLLDGAVDALAVGDVEVGEIVLGLIVIDQHYHRRPGLIHRSVRRTTSMEKEGRGERERDLQGHQRTYT